MSFMRYLLTCLSVLVIGGLARATWSIVAVDPRTGEVCVASATCLANFNLLNGVPVVRVGKGGAAAQSFVDVSGQNRMLIFESIERGALPAQILNDLAATDNQHQTRQYGIVTMDGAPTTFTGTGAFQWKGGVTGSVGSIKYSIQGNILTGAPVVMMAEDAFRNTDGDLGERVIAAMEAARAMGGDGRCSCSQFQPQSCGAPPASFTHSSYTGFVVLARPGDTDGSCNANMGCANGDYYLSLSAVSNPNGPDPVPMLIGRYHAWRGEHEGRPDHVLTEVDMLGDLVADGASSGVLRVQLRDIEGMPVLGAGYTVMAQAVSAGTPPVTLSPATQMGMDTFAFQVDAGTAAGRSTWRITVCNGSETVRLFPDISIDVAP